MVTRTKAPTDLLEALEYYLGEKAPVQIPAAAKAWIVRYGPFVAAVFLVLALPALLVALGLGFAMVPFAEPGFTLTLVGALVEIGLMLWALPGLFARELSGWWPLFYGALVGLCFALLRGAIVGGLVGTLLSLYVLFQIRPLYKA
jgi:hypothetical protein